MLVSYSGVGYFILFGGSRLLGYKYVECVCVYVHCVIMCSSFYFILCYLSLSNFYL